MKQPIPPSISAALAEVANIADRLAETDCICPAGKLADMSVSAVLNNLDHVASCLNLAELEDAPAMLNAAARAFRQTFPSDSIGWEDAAALNNAAVLISAHLPPVYAAWPNLPRRS